MSVFAWFIEMLWYGFTATALFHFFGWFTKLGRLHELWTGLYK